MKEMKYIVMSEETKDEVKELIFIFPKSINHDCMAEVLGRIKDQTGGNWRRVFRQPVSAGFTDGKECYGISESLRLKSRPQDTGMLK